METTLFFLHIPKAAGSTLHSIVNRQYKRGEIYLVDGSRVVESIDEFKRLPTARRKQFKVVSGHMPFGLHEHVPGPSTYITMLRDPVDRIISHYFYVRRTPNHYLHDQVSTRQMTLEEYAASGLTSELDNGQTRLVSGFEDVPPGKSSEEMLEVAKRNLEIHFAVVGTSEMFDETLVLLRRSFRWGIPYYVRRNITADRPLREQVSMNTLKLIEERNQLDTRLYRYAKALLTRQILRQGQTFQIEVGLLRAINGQYVRIEPLLRAPLRLYRSLRLRVLE